MHTLCADKCFALSRFWGFCIILPVPIEEGLGTSNLRIGIGYDTHRLGAGSSLRLGGVDVPHDRELIGHSDADVLLHAVTDALLGAASLGDIGQLFPDSDAVNLNRDSAEMLLEVRRQVSAAGFEVVNVDCVLFAERPKLAPFSSAICQRLAELLGVPATAVGLKAKTGEGVGPVGRKEAISAECVVLLEGTG